MNLKKLIDAFGYNWIDNGLFVHMVDAPWSTRFDNTYLDMQFFTEYGQRICSPLVDHFSERGTVSEMDKLMIANILLERFNENWTRRFQVLSAQYNPIENYDSTESEKINGTNTDTIKDNETHTKTVNLTDSENGTVKQTGTDSRADDFTNQKTLNLTTKDVNKEIAKNQNSLYGFNSDKAVPSDSDNGEKSVDATNTQTGTDSDKNSGTSTNTKNLTDTTENQITHSGTDEDQITRNNSTSNVNQTTRELKRHGNIGVTTSQQMLESEIKLWEWDFINGVFEDVCNILTIPIY